MLDFHHLLNNPNYDVQYFVAQTTNNIGATSGEWKTWRKPRGAKYIYMIGVGGGSSGGVGAYNAASTTGGGSGGATGGQTTLFIPAMFVPDTLYVQPGVGGQQPATLVSGAVNVGGTATYVNVEPSTTPISAMLNVLIANGGPNGSVGANTTAGGTATATAAVATSASMGLGYRGFVYPLAGQAGTAGGAPGVSGTGTGAMSSGLMVVNGSGGGGTGASGGAQAGVIGDAYITINGGAAGSGATPAESGTSGYIVQPFIHYGGIGGGGASTTAGGVAGSGGNGAPGCGGGGSGAASSANPTLARPGDGGPGFVYIITW